MNSFISFYFFFAIAIVTILTPSPVKAGPELNHSLPSWKIILNSDGTLNRMNQPQAITFCEGAGGRLPTAKELALITVGYGVAGVRDTAYPNSRLTNYEVRQEILRNQKDGYQMIHEFSIHKEMVVSFYINPKGYVMPADLRRFSPLYFWSSTVPAVLSGDIAYPRNAVPWAYYPYDEKVISYGSYYTDDDGGVICVFR